MLNVIICANFGVKKLRGLGNTRGKILESPIEMAGHPFNRAGATPQPVIVQFYCSKLTCEPDNILVLCRNPYFCWRVRTHCDTSD